ncbi:hypothetical protein [Deinococcus sp.]|uniref:hypothetical protein n=1 Tax=Deinococcus sp. TaxID=47478 RepID=UPI0025C36247|nr:hypothetical protein [Deinococcus sp.]
MSGVALLTHPDVQFVQPEYIAQESAYELHKWVQILRERHASVPAELEILIRSSFDTLQGVIQIFPAPTYAPDEAVARRRAACFKTPKIGGWRRRCLWKEQAF